MSTWAFLAENSAAFAAVAVFLGLLIGSFLNVVIYRLPLMMEREWRGQCRELLGVNEDSAAAAPAPAFNLITPRSRCPHCERPVAAAENIPLLSYLWLKGRCAGCGARISLRYPLIEAITGMLSGVVAWHFGFGWEAAAALILTWGLIALTVIDFDHQLLPDSLTLPLLWLGLLLSIDALFVDSGTSIIGAAAGYLCLWTIYVLFKWATGKEGMGYGDFKLLAMLGAWVGWQGLPVIVLLSSVVGAAVGISLILIRGRDRNIPIPFGPYLATAGWLTLLWGDAITARYFALLGLPAQ